MSTGEERHVSETVRGLEAVTDATPRSLQTRLDAARRLAVEGGNGTARRGWLWAGAAVAVVVGALALGIVIRPNPETAPPAPAPVADADLYQDLEFYVWLAEELDSSSDSRS